jgi:hypothetical protein
MPSRFRFLAVIIVAVAGFVWSGAASAWGNAGHRTVCEIAYLNMTPAARAEASRLLQSLPAALRSDPRNLDFASACTYPDRPLAGGPDRRASEHFINYPRETAAVTLQSGCGLAFECADTAIIGDYAELRSPFLSDQLRAVALIYLGHFVGDIHQPLHNSFADDRGGNSVLASGLCSGSLHSAWDTCILVSSSYGSVADPAPAAVEAAAAAWSAAVTDAQRAQWLSTRPWQWSYESYLVATSPAVGYCVMIQSTCQYDSTHALFAGSNPRTVAIDARYEAMAVPIVRQRITQAGIRLAHLINLALDPAYRWEA